MNPAIEKLKQRLIADASAGLAKVFLEDDTFRSEVLAFIDAAEEALTRRDLTALSQAEHRLRAAAPISVQDEVGHLLDEAMAELIPGL